jgi:hypothetical protein
VVGDRFARQLDHSKVVPITEFLLRLHTGAAPPVAVGQGLSADQLDELRHWIDVGRVELAGALPAFADVDLTHKHDPTNVMITQPMRVADGEYVADLLIDERCEVLADHLTGQHIPAIALIEAARQTWTAVTERFYATAAGARFVVGAVESSFDRLVFPVPATLRYRLLSRSNAAPGITYRCHVTIEQNGQVAADIVASYRTVPSRVAEKHELLAARQVMAGVHGRSASSRADQLARHNDTEGKAHE